MADDLDPAVPTHLLGWVDDAGRPAITATLPWPSFSAAAPDAMGADVDVFLFKAWKDALGAYPDYVAQAIGDCTSWGAGHAVDLLTCIEMVLGHEPIGYLETCTEAIYGMGREIAGMRGGDGCYGSAVAKALTDMGAVSRELVGPYSGKRAKLWGGRKGVPAEIKQAAAQFKLGAAVLVGTLEELDAALANGYPVTVASNQGFTMTRDANGVCAARGHWGHQMMICARRTRDGKRQYLICQSWGPGVPSGPQTDDQPDFSFWAEERPIAGMLRVGDSFAFSAFPGFVKRALPSAWAYSDFM